MTPMVSQRLAELKIAERHAEAAHARLVKEAREARRAERGSSRWSGLLGAVRKVRPAVRPAAAPAGSRVPRKRIAAKSAAC